MAEEAKMVPKLRFKGFSEPWRQETPRKYLTESRIPGTNGKTARKLTVKLWGKGIAEKTESYSGSEKTKYYIRKAGQLMYGKLDFLHQAFGIVPNRLDGYQSTLDSPAFDISSEINSNFLLSEISRKEFYERLGKIANGSRKAKRIHVDTFFDMPMVIPKIKEQNQISRIIETTNSAITLHEEKLEQLKALKRGMLQDLFPDQGETTPVLRQKGFKDAWKKHKFMESIDSITDFRGRTPKKLGMNWSTEGVLALSAQNVKDGYIDKTIDAHYGSQDLYDKWMGGRELHKGQVVFTTEAPMGNVARIPDENKYILSQRTIAFNIKEDMLTESFLMYLLESQGVRNNLLRFSSGGTAKGVSQKTLSSLMVIIPTSLKEQARISFEFYNLDYLITLHQHKLDKLHSLKKFLLQNLFI